MSNALMSESKVEGHWNHSMTAIEFLEDLQHFYHNLLISNYGPKSCLTLIRNLADTDFVTSSSSKILQQVSFKHPCFKFINALMNAQFKSFGVHSLYVGILCSGILFRCLKIEKHIGYSVLKEVSCQINNILLEAIDNLKLYYLDINIGKLTDTLSIVRSVVYSKFYCTLTKDIKEFIATKIVETFLQTIPECNQKDFNYFNIKTSEGGDILDSHLIDGILYQEHDLTNEQLQMKLQTLPRNPKIVVFVVPLSLDVEEKKNVKWEASHHSSSLKNQFNENLVLLLNKLKKNECNVIACQKFIDPAIKYDLNKNGFLVLDRLGTITTACLIDLAECCAINDLSAIETSMEKFIGSVSSIRLVTIAQKIYLNIQHTQPFRNTLTFFLMGANQYDLEYLEETFMTCVHLLQRVVRDSDKLMPGGGCLEVYLATQLIKKKIQIGTKLAHQIDAHVSKIHLVFDAYVDALISLSASAVLGGNYSSLVNVDLDDTLCHVRPSEGSSDSCVCGVASSFTSYSLLNLKNGEIPSRASAESTSSATDLEVADVWSAKANAVRMALNGATELLDVGICIFDQ